ncbi:bestrophin family protein [Flavobacterium saccharophilum]|uniref:Putative membrane protein n=1 Tax=Flavobacterium saccharophilum TaxID=29534 RepID=A0A1M7DCC4_9FLAO|nr:bestrophin family ion channel [Flavobacterium saccharophilum]SHL77124.1 putative membrane protein [Flavobacterium saccharophilum]
MFVNNSFSFSALVKFSGGYLLWIIVWSFLVLFSYEFLHLKWIAIPWVSIGIIGTAVSFYIGFKNNQSYERIWEARKIWGTILNISRMWGVTTRGYIKNHLSSEKFTEEEIAAITKKLIYRNIAYVYAFRAQLSIPTSWEHITLGTHIAKRSRRSIEKVAGDTLEDDFTKEMMEKYLNSEEYADLKRFRNMATHIIDLQSQDLMQLRKDDIINDFYHVQLQTLLNNLYDEQGKAERIKNFPLPRLYAYASNLFVWIFIFLLPFGLIAQFDQMGHYNVWLFIPVVSIVSWIFLLMELVGDYSENPFGGLPNDIPMLSICRTIEIDLKHMLKEEDIPKSIKAQNGILL